MKVPTSYSEPLMCVLFSCLFSKSFQPEALRLSSILLLRSMMTIEWTLSQLENNESITHQLLSSDQNVSWITEHHNLCLCCVVMVESASVGRVGECPVRTYKVDFNVILCIV